MHKKDTSCFLTGLTTYTSGEREGIREGAWPCGLDMSPEGSQGQSFLTPRAMLPEAEEMNTYLLPARAHAGLLGPHGGTKHMYMMN